MSKSQSNFILYGILAGTALGIAGVFLFPGQLTGLGWMGDFFLRSLQMVIVPLVAATIVSGVTSMGDIRLLKGVGARTVGFYIMTTSCAILLGIILVMGFAPGSGFPRPEGLEAPASAVERSDLSFADLVLSVVHPNIVGALAQQAMLPIIVFFLVLGGVLTTLGEKGKPLIALFDGLTEAMMKVIGLILWLAPIGVFGLICKGFGHLERAELAETVGSVAGYATVVLAGLALHTLVVLPVICWLLARRNPYAYMGAMAPALLTAWSTGSSSATLPVTMECAENRGRVNPKAASFVLPLGATVNMDGTALYLGVAVIFIAQVFGVDLSVVQIVLMFLTTVLISIGVAGVPQAGLAMMVIILNSLGLPLEGIALIMPIDAILDRFRTVTNVWGDSIGAAFIDRSV